MWRRIANVNETIEIKSLVSGGPKNLHFTMASRRATLSGNTSLIATFSIVVSVSVVVLQVGCLLSVTLMLLARHNHVVLYLGTAIFGMFLSSVAPTSISLAESYIDVTCTS